MENTGKQNNKRALFLILLILLAASAVILAVVLTVPELHPPSPRRLKANTLNYEAITDVEVARQLVVHPGAELAGFRYHVDGEVKGVRTYVQIYRNGVYLGPSGSAYSDIVEGGAEGGIRVSFGVRPDHKGVDWCVSQDKGGMYAFTDYFAEDFNATGWVEGILNVEEGAAAVAIEKDVPVALSYVFVSPQNAIRTYGIHRLNESIEAREEGYLFIFCCEFYTEKYWDREELFIGLYEYGECIMEVDATSFPMREHAEAAIEEFTMTSAAWSKRDIATLPQCISIRQQQPGQENQYKTYYAFRLEDGTPVLQSEETEQFSVISGATYDALLEGASGNNGAATAATFP